jgi:hypothetical protein
MGSGARPVNLDPAANARLFGALAAAAGVLAVVALGRYARKHASESHRLHIRQVNAGAAALAFSVLADSGLEHFRGGFYNRAMLVAPAVSSATLAAAGSAAAIPAKVDSARRGVYAAAAITGLAGFAFHVYDITRRTGGWNWLNLFYAAPIGAPMALNLAGLLGLAGSSLARTEATAPRLLGKPAGRVLGLGVAAALVGTAAEAALLHFRGAFQSRYMYLPVTVPPAAALALAGAVTSKNQFAERLARILLRATALLGIAGTGFHARGIAPNMGGWRNWTQNVQHGPPLPAPPSFSGLALAGLGALNLRDTGKEPP